MVTPVIEEKRKEAPPSADPVMQDNEEALLRGHENHHLDQS